MAQLMPLPLTVSCFSEIQIGFTLLVPEKGPLNGYVCVRACVCDSVSVIRWENTTSSIIICTLHKPILQGDRATAVGNMRLFGEVWTCDSRDMLTGRHTDPHMLIIILCPQDYPCEPVPER